MTERRLHRAGNLTARSLALLLLSACGGGGSEPTGGGTSNPPPPAGTTYSASGIVYARSDTIAYAAEATSAPVLGGASIGFGSATATGTASGSFTIATTTTLAGDFLDVTASSPGYQAGWAPYLTYEPTRPVNIALYPDVTVAPRAGFVKGIDFMDSGGGLQTFYDGGRHAQVMDRVRAQDGANLVMTTEHLGVTRFQVATNTVAMTTDPFGLYSRAVYQNLSAQAKARGLQYMMSIAMEAYAGNVPAPIDAAGRAEWVARSQIPRTNEAFWDAFFAAWRPLILERATIARDLGVEYFNLGFNLDFLTRTDVSRWRRLISDIRALGYTGKITYFGNPRVHTGISEWDAVDPALPGLFDVVGLRMSTVVARSSASEVLSRTQSRARMRASVSASLAKLSGVGRPILVFLTVPSVHGGVVDPEYIEPCILASCGSTAPLRTRDFQQQADAYQAVAEAINATPTGNGRVMGLITAQFWYFENFQSGGNGAYDKGSNIRGKPAEAVLRWWFQRW